MYVCILLYTLHSLRLLPAVKMNINIVVVGISLLPVVKMNGRCALIKTLAIPITGILSLTMYPGHSHKGSRPPESSWFLLRELQFHPLAH